MRNTLTICALLASASVTMPAAAAADQPNNAALRFGIRDNVLGVGISPDGTSLVVVQPNGPRGAIASVVKLDGTNELKAIVRSDGNPERLTSCRWSSNTRVVCTIFGIDMVYGKHRPASRLLAIDADGTHIKQLSARNNERTQGVSLGGGEVIDWLSDSSGGSSVLMTRWFLPEASTGHVMGQIRVGYGVERVDTESMQRRTLEYGNPAADEYITDGRGNVRIMGLTGRNTLGETRNVSEYRYRKKGSREWLPLGTVTHLNYHETGFDPYAVDPDLNVAYGFDSVSGRSELYKVSLDGSLKKELVLAEPNADIDDLIQIGRQQRVVGASYVTDRRQVVMFDPELRKFSQALSKALPGAPLVSIVDASADEQKLIVFAGSDTDPGRFYFYDKATKHLGEILPVRPLLADVKLAQVKPISFPAADGKMVPAYMTIPPGSDGKNLPAIVLPHGGPSYRDVWSFDWLPQYFVSRGYAVIQPNFRGSTGYGQEWFQQNGIRSWRQSIGDIDDAGRWLVKQGIADPTKLAIVGWSYGGYAALQSQVVDPTLFKAVVAIAPVTDFGVVRAESEHEGDTTQVALDAVFGDAAVAQAGSPARHADAFKAPVLMFHANLDQNVSIEQSRLMKDRLEGAGKRVQLIEYKGLDHQLDDSAVRADVLDKADTFLRASMGM